jgi:hypothetical protein
MAAGGGKGDRDSEASPLRSEVECMYYACMPNVQVRDVPDQVHEELVRRADLAGQSLQQFLAAQLALIAATPTIDEMLKRIERRPKGHLSAASAIKSIDGERARR